MKTSTKTLALQQLYASNLTIARRKLTHLALLVFLSMSAFLQAQTFTTQANGAWNAGATWVGGVAPANSTSNNIVILHSVTQPGADFFCGTLTIQSGGTLNPGQRNLTVHGNFTVNAGGTFDDNNATGTNTFNATSVNNGSFSSLSAVVVGTGATFTNNATASIAGALQAAATSSTFVNAANASLTVTNAASPMATPALGTLNATATGNEVIYASTASPQNVRSTNYWNLTVAANGLKRTFNTITVLNNLVISAGTLERDPANTGTFTVEGTTSITGSNGIYNHSSAGGLTVFKGLVTVNSTTGTPLNASVAGGTIEFQSGIVNNGNSIGSNTMVARFTTNNQSISGSAAATFRDMIIGEGVEVTYNCFGALTVGTILDGLDGSSKLTLATNRTLNYGGAGIPMNTGLLDPSANNCTVNYSGGNQTIKSTILPYHHLTISGSLTKTMENGNTYTIEGNLTRGANVGLTTTGATLLFQGASNTSIIGNSGTWTVTLFNTTVNKSPGSSLTIVNGAGSFGAITFENLNVTSGTFNLGTVARNITVNNTLSGSVGVLDASGAAHTINLNGSSNSIASFLGGSSSTVVYGGANQTVFGSANYFNLQVGGTANSLKSLAGAVRLHGALHFSANVLLALGNNTIKLSPSASLTSSGAFGVNRMILTDGEGAFVKEGNAIGDYMPALFSATFDGAPNSRIIPLGTTSSPTNFYTPFGFRGGNFSGTHAMAMGFISVRAVPSRQPNIPYFNNALNKFWDVETSNITITSVDVAFQYNNAEVVGNELNYTPRVFNPVTSAVEVPANPAKGSFTGRSLGGTLLRGQWTMIDPAISTTIYSYQSGDWSNINVWTTDASGTTLVPPPNVPTTNDVVVILNGRTITTSASRTVSSLTIEGGATLELGSSTGHNLGVVSGTGTLRLSTPVFPGGNFGAFTGTTGGTVEYFNLPNAAVNAMTQIVYNNLTIRNSGSADFNLTLNTSPMVVNGTFSMTRSGSGAPSFVISDAASARTVRFFGNVNIGAGCVMQVGDYNAEHTVEIHRNFTINGTVNFQRTTDFAGSGPRARIRFLNPNFNATVTCNAGANVRFGRFLVEKNDGFEVFVSAAPSPSASVAFVGGSETISPITGTLRLGANISIDRINNGGNYDLGTTSQTPVLWVDGATVFAGPAAAFVAYGTLRVSAGLYDAGSIAQAHPGTQNSIVLRETGLMEISGGVVNCRIFRVSNTSAAHRGAYVQTGGTFNATSTYGNTAVPAMPPFSLVYPDNVFTMTGGTLNVAMTGGTVNGFIINSLPQNIEVTGGTVNFRLSVNSTFGISSTAPLFNLNILRTTGSGAHTLSSINWDLGGAGGSGTAPARPLVVLGNFNLVSTSPPVFNANASDVIVHGDMSIESGTTFNGGTGTLWFSGQLNQNFLINGSVGSGLGNLRLNKNNTTVTVNGLNASFQANGDLIIDGGILNDNGRVLSFRGNIVNNGTHTGTASGRIVLNATAASQTISGSGPFNNIELNNTNGAAGSAQITAGSDININGNLTMTSDRIFDLENRRLSLGASSQILGTFSANRHIRTQGFLSDGGIAKTFSNTTAFVFPFGTGANNYTPATVKFNSIPSTWGTIDLRPVTSRQLYVTSLDCFEYYWRLNQTGITGVVPGSLELTFNYGDLPQNTSYIPGYYNFQAIAYTTINDVNKVVESVTPALRNILFENWSQLAGDYTAGNPSAFGVVIPFYSRANGDWNNPNTWSNVSHTGPASTLVPDGSKPVFIGNGIINHTVTVSNNTRQSGSLIVDNGSTLDLGATTGHNFGALPFSTAGGAGRIRITSLTPVAEFPAGDFGLFFTSTGGTTEYYSNSFANDFTIPTVTAAPTSLNIATYRNLVLNPASSLSINLPNRDLTIFNNFIVNGNPNGVASMSQANARTITVNGEVRVTSGRLQFVNNAAQTINAQTNVVVEANGEILVQNTGAINHTIRLQGSLSNLGKLNLNESSKVNLVFESASNALFTGTQPAAQSNIAGLTLNKGTGPNALLTLNVAGTLTTPGSNWLNLQNGTFRIAKNTSITLSDNVGQFLLPASTKIEVDQNATVNVAFANDNFSDFLLEGTLEIINGTVNVGNVSNTTHNDLIYAPTSLPRIIVRNNSQLNVNGQIRRSTAAFLGSLVYEQYNNSTVFVRGINPQLTGNNLNRAKFEILNPGSSFTMADNATLIIDRRGVASGIFGDILLNPASSNITGGTIVVGSANTDIAFSTFVSNINMPLHNLTIDGNTSSKTLLLGGNPLEVRGNLRIESNSVLNTNGQDVTILGNFLNQNSDAAAGFNTGGYRTINGNQVTTFASTAGVQTISGVSGNITNFARLVFNNTAPSGAINLAANTAIRINSDHSILSGNFNSGANNVDVVGNVINNTIHTSTGAGRYALIGNNPSLGGNGNGEFGNLRLQQSAGEVTLQANTRVNGTLTLATGNFFLGGNTLTLGPSAIVSGSFSANTMIRTNGVASDGGLRKLYPAAASPVFTYPIGVTLKYTPATMHVTANSAAGEITVRPVNTAHPATTDIANNTELLYFWATGASGFSPSASIVQTYRYFNLDVQGDVNLYRTGRYQNLIWNPQFGFPGSVNPSLQLLTVNSTGAAEVNGEYTAGYQQEFDQILIFYSRNATLGGNWNDVNAWSIDQVQQHAGPPAPTTPNFNSIVIAPGHTIVAVANNYNTPTAQIDGTLNLGNTFGHNLGVVTGTGRIRMTPNAGNFIFPGGTFNSFVAAGGGTVEYFTNSLGTLPSRSLYNNVVFSGTGVKNLFNTDITLNGNLTIDGGTVQNPNNKDVSLAGNFINNAAVTAFQLGSGTLTLNGLNQSFTAGSVSLTNLTVNGGGLKTLDNVSLTVTNLLTLNNGRIVTGSGLVQIGINGNVVNGNANSYVRGTLEKVISVGTVSKTFEIGGTNFYSPAVMDFNGTTNGGGRIAMFTVGGDHPSIGSSGINPSQNVNRYWNVQNIGVSGFSTYNITFNFNPAEIDVGAIPAQFKVARFASSNWTLPNVGVLTGTSTQATGLGPAATGDFIVGMDLVGGLTWTGNVSTNWNDPLNWLPNFVPSASDNVIIPLTANQPSFTTAPLNANAFNVSLGAGASINIPAAYTLNVHGNSWSAVNNSITGSGNVRFTSSPNINMVGTTTFHGVVSVNTGTTLNTNNGMVIANGGALMHGAGTAGAGGSVTGNVTVRRQGSNLLSSYNFWSSPVANANGTVIGNNNRFLYNPLAAINSTVSGLQQGWQPFSGVMTPGRGYISTGAGLVGFNGAPNQGNITNSTIAIGPFSAYNVVGNPYPSGLKASDFTAANPHIIGGSLYFWDDPNTGGGYQSSDYATWNGIGFTSPITNQSFTGVIGSCQGFLIRVSAANPVVFNNSMRSASNNVFFENEIIGRVFMRVNAGQHTNELLIGFKHDASDDLDYYDAVKMKGNAQLSFFSKVGGEDCAIQGLSELTTDKVVQLGVTAPNAGPQTMHLHNVENMDATAQIILEDTKMGVFQNLRQNATYAYNYEPASDENRFRLHFKPGVSISVTTESCQQNDATINIQSPSLTQWDYMVKNETQLVVAQGTGFSGLLQVPNLTAGDYTVQLTNTFGTVLQIPVSIHAGSAISATLQASATQAHVSNAAISFNTVVTGAADITWNFGDGTIVTGVTNPVHVYTAAGVYQVTLIASNANCMDVKTMQITITDDATGLSNAANENAHFSIFPNPAREVASIKLNMPASEEQITVCIVDQAGRMVQKDVFNRVDRKAILEIRVDGLASGNYQVVLRGNRFSGSTQINVSH